MNVPEIFIAIIVASVIYLILIRIDDAKVRDKCVAPTSVAIRTVIFFSILIVCIFVLHFGKDFIPFNKNIRSIELPGGESIDTTVLKLPADTSMQGFDISKINENVSVGIPPF